MSEDVRKVDGKDLEGNDVVLYVKKPSVQDYRDSQIEYNKAFRSALEGGAILKKRLADYMRDQGIWDDDKDSQEQRLLKEIAGMEGTLNKGGIPLKQAKDTALDLREQRMRFRNLIAERTMLDSNTVEGQSDNARFNYLVSHCMLDHNKLPRFKNISEYDSVAEQPWAAKAAGELANMIYELDPDYDKNLVENRFLVDYEFADDKLRLVNSDGHLIDLDDDGVERLIDSDGRFVAYKSAEGREAEDENERYFVNRQGEEVTEEGDIKDGFVPFLDDKGKPVELPVDETEVEAENEAESDVEAETKEEIVASEEKPKPGRPKKTTKNT